MLFPVSAFIIIMDHFDMSLKGGFQFKREKSSAVILISTRKRQPWDMQRDNKIGLHCGTNSLLWELSGCSFIKQNTHTEESTFSG